MLNIDKPEDAVAVANHVLNVAKHHTNLEVAMGGLANQVRYLYPVFSKEDVNKVAAFVGMMLFGYPEILDVEVSSREDDEDIQAPLTASAPLCCQRAPLGFIAEGGN